MRFVVWRLLRALIIAAIFAAAVIGISSISSLEEKHYEITDADVDVELQRDGSLIVTERLTFDFSGNFSGAYREFPLNGGARVTDVVVREGSQEYDAGGNTTLGSFDRPGTYGTISPRGSDFRIVWHYDASDEERTFDVVYRVVDATTVHDDVVDVSWTVWGDQWAFWLDDLDASISARSGVAPERAWLRPRSLGVEPDRRRRRHGLRRTPARGRDGGPACRLPARRRHLHRAAPRSSRGTGCPRSRRTRPGRTTSTAPSRSSPTSRPTTSSCSAS